eukprot:TRINITY_DN2739_c0_g1_i1.p1 TRINITY_DN2739_c0_g1~~TRINITY_DN2739_c0_g1_i1.p1  ORF type:complete len:57 (-),score=2.11 TRINITY_DN2739_c0_g1_i1:218-388(-)
MKSHATRTAPVPESVCKAAILLSLSASHSLPYCTAIANLLKFRGSTRSVYIPCQSL